MRLPSLRKVGLMALATAVMLAAVSDSVVDALHASGARHKELYEVLGVPADATKSEIKKAFRALTRTHHPDTKETYDEKEAAKAEMAKLLRAYEVLSDDAKRGDYDDAGIIPGEAPNVDEMTADELFAYYHQSAPIFSKAATLTSMTDLRRLRSFRGGRLFLIQIYDDQSCTTCRQYATAWETLYQSALVDAKVMEMYRIDALSEEGKVLIGELGVRYKKEPYVLAIVDGEVWTLYGIPDVLKQRHDRNVFHHLLEFVMNFYYETYQGITSLEVMQLDDILQFLRAPRPADRPVRVLLPQITAESIPLGLQVVHPSMELRSVPRETLLEFVEEYCEMEVDVKDRFGESIPMPEFMVLSEEALPAPPSDVETLGADEDVTADSAATATPEKSCRLIHIGASVALTYPKAAKFVEAHLPLAHPEMKGVKEATSFEFLDLCRKNCLVWARPDCSVAPAAAMVDLLDRDYLSFKPGYICLDKEPKLAKTLTKAGVVGAAGQDVHLFALVGGNDTIVYPLLTVGSTPQGERSAQQIEAILAELVQRSEESAAGEAQDDSSVPLQVVLPSSISSELTTDGFPMSNKQRWYVQANNIYGMVKPIAAGFWPFLMMFIVHKYIINRNKPETEEEKKEREEAERKKKEREEAAAAAKANGGKPVRRRVRKPQPQVGPYNDRDLTWAKEEKGFLIFLVDERPLSAGTLPLPRLATEEPFVVRIMGSTEGRWKQWIASHKPVVADGAAGLEEVPEEERGISIMAIRKTRMKSVIKSDAQSIDAFLRDLLDGTKNPSDELPTWAYDDY